MQFLLLDEKIEKVDESEEQKETVTENNEEENKKFDADKVRDHSKKAKSTGSLGK